MLTDLVLEDGKLSLSIDGGPASFDYFWLRDNARDPVSFDSRSHQRELFTASIDPDIRPRNARVSDTGDSLLLNWPDLDGEAQYEAAFLADFAIAADPMRMPPPQPWDAAGLGPDAVRLSYGEFSADGGVVPLLQKLLAHGFAVLTDMPRHLDSVSEVAESIGYVRQTIFGGLFEFEANEDMADSAYTPKELRPHTDGTYSHDAPGVQLLLCVDYDAEGGESIMVDGAAIAADLKTRQPQIYEDLTRIGVTGVYKGDGVVLRARRPILRLDDTGELAQVSFNNYDRDTVRLADDDMRSLYAGIRAFDGMANDPAYQWRYTLAPGDMLVFDNWRVLHGRGAFRGKRKMAGAYINREDFESRVRACGLI
ncbi:MAG: TauD/TfdA family dioxygenase [Pseudomonadota bacterium]|nr:TauD/TfdA family dioxygenase [Pseudomonadota bacterium]MEC8244913.1 TauD/TfdA family dioxygenase [Pseudomonadota bacterium]MEC9141597.1 TauD/TfdA family dioxygenase [Pseudomonadota bacterium]